MAWAEIGIELEIQRMIIMAERVVINNPVADALDRLIDHGINTVISTLIQDKNYNRARADRLTDIENQRTYSKEQAEQQALVNLYRESAVNAVTGLGIDTPQEVYDDRESDLENLVGVIKEDKTITDTYRDLTLQSVSNNLKVLQDRRYVTDVFKEKRKLLNESIEKVASLGIGDGTFLNDEKSKLGGVSFRRDEAQKGIEMLADIEKQMEIGKEESWLRINSEANRVVDELDLAFKFHDALSRYDYNQDTPELDAHSTAEVNPINSLTDASLAKATELARGGEYRLAIRELAEIPNRRNILMMSLEAAAAKGDIKAAEALEKAYVQIGREHIKTVQDSFRKVRNSDNKYFEYWGQMDADMEGQATGQVQVRIAENIASTLMSVGDGWFNGFPANVQTALKDYKAESGNPGLMITVMDAVLSSDENKLAVIKRANFPGMAFLGGKVAEQRTLANMINAYEYMRGLAARNGVEAFGTGTVMPALQPLPKKTASGRNVTPGGTPIPPRLYIP